MTRLSQLCVLLSVLLGLAGCDSGGTGNLLSSDDDDSVGDDDDSVGDDDDSVGDDDDSVGDDDDDDDDDDDGSPWSGFWEGEASLTRVLGNGGEQQICTGAAEFLVYALGDIEGAGDCQLPQNNEATFEWSGQLSDDGELMNGEAVMTTPQSGTTDWWLEGGIYEENGEVYIYVWWEPKLGGGGGGGGGGGFYGDAWAVR
jgi:hypothetical protein